MIYLMCIQHIYSYICSYEYGMQLDEQVSRVTSVVRFTSKHPSHHLSFALANEFAFPDPEKSQQVVLKVLDLVLQMPCQLGSSIFCSQAS